MTRQMHIASGVFNNLGASPHAWLDPRVDLADWTDIRSIVRHAQTAERGKLDFLFLGDFLAQSQRAESMAPGQTLEPTVVATAIALSTQHIGMVNTVSTTFTEPYNIARTLKSLDVVSGGRMGWNAITTSAPPAAANFGRTIADRDTRYAQANEVIQVVQALWGSWEPDALLGDRENRRFTDMSKIAPINLQGQYVASRGPLEVPPSPQGQPVIAHAGTSPHSQALAGRYADLVISEVWTIEDAREQREAIRAAAVAAGREADDVLFFAGIMPTIGDSHAEALERRGRLMTPDDEQRAPYLGALIGLPLGVADLDRRLSEAELAAAVANPGDPRSPRALEVAREGWTVREVLHHSVIDYHPSPIGTPEMVADHMQQWFEAEACDGFWFMADIMADGLDAFVDRVVPILQERGLFRTEYEGTTLRENLGAKPQYGLRTP